MEDLRAYERKLADTASELQRAKDEMARVIVGQEEILELCLAGVLAGGHFGAHVYEKTADGKPQPANVCHLLGALDLSGFGDPEAFQQRLAQYQNELRSSAKAEGEERIFVHGEREFEMAERHAEIGAPIHPKSVGTMRFIAGELGIPYTLD